LDGLFTAPGEAGKKREREAEKRPWKGGGGGGRSIALHFL